MKLESLLGRTHAAVPDTRGAILPDGVKCVLPIGNGCIAVHQTPPRVYSFRWIAANSPAEYGPGTSYRQVRLALPYLLVLAAFERARGGLPQLSSHNECFFLNQPLDAKGLETELCYPALLNCSRFPDSPGHPLSWICTQNLSSREFGRAQNLDQSLRIGLQALLHHLLETGFNRSSEHHEMSSWFAESVAARIDPRIASVEAWERATAEDPLFVLEVPWIPTGFSLQKVVERIGEAHGPSRARVTCAEDVARLILNATHRSRRTP
jgi:hypothetical protein